MIEQHIVPRDDIKEHVTDGKKCWCIPAVHPDGDVVLIVHTALDGREGAEGWNEVTQ